MDACAFLGKVYEEGILLPQDLPKSVDYYKRTLSSNHPYAAYRLALKMIKGKL
jgi:TPR repeat protein